MSGQLVFREIELSDISVLREYFAKVDSRFCDRTIGGAVVWRRFFKTKFCESDGDCYFKATYANGTDVFSVPISDDKVSAMEKLLLYIKMNNYNPVFGSVSPSDVAFLRENFDVSEIVSDRDWFDYLYNSADMITFAGKKFNGQRNHMNKFKKLYPSYDFEKITPDNIEKARSLFNKFFEERPLATPMQHVEIGNIAEVLDNYGQFGFSGGLLTVDGVPVAAAIGDKIGDTLFVHIEKADTSYHGAYQMIVNEFAKCYATDEIAYINREEDVGIEGLRTSKLSYHPVQLLEKSTVRLNV